MKNLLNLYQSTRKSQNWDFDEILLSKVENVWAVNYKGIMCQNNEEWYKIRRGIDLLFQIETTVWQTLTQALKYLTNLHFNGLLFTKVYNVWAKKVQKCYVWWQLRLMQKHKGKLTFVFQNDIRKFWPAEK